MKTKSVILLRQSGRLTLAGILLLVAGALSLIYIRLMPMPDGVITNVGLLTLADRTVIYNSTLLCPHPLLWTAVLLISGAVLTFFQKQKAVAAVLGACSALGLLAALLPMPQGGIDSYFDAVYWQGFLTFFACLWASLTLCGVFRRLMPAKVISIMLIPVHIYVCWRVLYDRFYLFVSDAVIVLLILAAVCFVLFSAEREKVEVPEPDFFEELDKEDTDE